jgi:hypothetical protein
VLAVFVLTACVSAVQFNQYRLVRMRGAVYEDVKEIGLKLKREHVATHVYYVPFETHTDVISARPELIYYSTMPVGGAALTDVAGLASVFRTRTHQVFVRGENVYVVAVRYIP